jgi:hypothetical protein
MQTHRFQAKISWWIVVFIGSILGLTALLLFWLKAWIGFIPIALVGLFAAYIFTSTVYLVDDKTITIKIGMLYRETIPIQSIKKICAANSILSEPANSTQRLIIFYYGNHKTAVSPKNKEEFIRLICSLNTEIETKV